jgi:hypothetical protein
MLAHLVRNRAFYEKVSDATVTQTVRAYRIGFTTYVTAMLLALVAPVLSFAAYLAIVVYFMIPQGVDADI